MRLNEMLIFKRMVILFYFSKLLRIEKSTQDSFILKTRLRNEESKKNSEIFQQIHSLRFSFQTLWCKNPAKINFLMSSWLVEKKKTSILNFPWMLARNKELIGSLFSLQNSYGNLMIFFWPFSRNSCWEVILLKRAEF